MGVPVLKTTASPMDMPSAMPIQASMYAHVHAHVHAQVHQLGHCEDEIEAFRSMPTANAENPFRSEPAFFFGYLGSMPTASAEDPWPS